MNDATGMSLDIYTQALPVPAVVIDVAKNIYVCNRAARPLFGASSATLDHFLNIFSPPDRPNISNTLRGASREPIRLRTRLSGTPPLSTSTVLELSVASIETGQLIVVLYGGASSSALSPTKVGFPADHRFVGRSCLEERLTHSMSRSKRRATYPGLALVDASVQDADALAPGELGDIISFRLTHCVRESDTVTVLEPQLFAVLIEDVVSDADFVSVVERIFDVCEMPLLSLTNPLVPNIRIGRALATADSTSAHLLDLAFGALNLARLRDLDIFSASSSPEWVV